MRSTLSRDGLCIGQSIQISVSGPGTCSLAWQTCVLSSDDIYRSSGISPFHSCTLFGKLPGSCLRAYWPTEFFVVLFKEVPGITLTIA